MAKFDGLFVSQNLSSLKAKPCAVTKLDAIVMGICVPERIAKLSQRCDENVLYMCAWDELQASTLLKRFPTDTVAADCKVELAQDVTLGASVLKAGFATVHIPMTVLSMLELTTKNGNKKFNAEIFSLCSPETRLTIEEILSHDPGIYTRTQLVYSQLAQIFNILNPGETPVEMFMDGDAVIVGVSNNKIAMTISQTIKTPLLESSVIESIVIGVPAENDVPFACYLTVGPNTDSLANLNIAIPNEPCTVVVKDYVKDVPIVLQRTVNSVCLYKFVNIALTNDRDNSTKVVCDEIEIQLAPGRRIDRGSEIARQLNAYYSGAFIKKRLKEVVKTMYLSVADSINSQISASKMTIASLDNDFETLQKEAAKVTQGLCKTTDLLHSLENPKYLSTVKEALTKTLSNKIPGAATVFFNANNSVLHIVLDPIFVEAGDQCYKTGNLSVNINRSQNNRVTVEYCNTLYFDVETVNTELILDLINACDFIKLTRALRARIATEILTDVNGKYQYLVQTITRDELLANL